LAVETGLRKEELFGLTVAALDLDRREIVLNQTKSGLPRRVPISQTATATIQALLTSKDRPRNAEYLFVHHDGTRYRDFKRAFNAARARARIIGFRWYDLRHTFASWWVQRGGDLYHLSRILGHATTQISSR
jgi:integrase/recombinase XerD